MDDPGARFAIVLSFAMAEQSNDIARLRRLFSCPASGFVFAFSRFEFVPIEVLRQASRLRSAMPRGGFVFVFRRHPRPGITSVASGFAFAFSMSARARIVSRSRRAQNLKIQRRREQFGFVWYFRDMADADRLCFKDPSIPGLLPSAALNENLRTSSPRCPFLISV